MIGKSPILPGLDTPGNQMLLSQNMPDFVREDQMLSVAEVAARLNCIPSYVRHLCRRELIGHYKFGKFLKFDQSQIDAFLAKHKVEVFVQPEPKRKISPIDMRMGRF